MNQPLSITIRSLDEQPELVSATEAFLEASGASVAAKSRVFLALDELVVNALSHGYPPGPAVPYVQVTMSVVAGDLRIDLVDGGIAFDPLAAPEPDTTLGVEQRPIGGLGVHLVKRLMDQVEYVREADSNRLRLTLRLHAPPVQAESRC